jgi:Fe-S cluster assembly iron-binding protein IscA
MLDKNSIQSFLDTGVSSIFISFIESGCAGTKVSVETEFERTGLVSSPIAPGLTAFYRRAEQEVLEQGHITFAKGKWLFSSEKVQDRCGCGESFSFEKKLIDSSKLTKLQGVFGQRKKGLHE